MYLFDTNACIAILNGSSNNLVTRLALREPEDIFLSAVTKAELVYGAYNSDRIAANLRIIEELASPYKSLAFDDKCVHVYGRIRADLRRAGTPVGANDMFIAATAIAYNLTLVTANTREFGRIPGLRLENWEV